MSRATRDDLDARIRRAWPVTPEDLAPHTSDATHLRARIDARIAMGGDPDGAAHELRRQTAWDLGRRLPAVLTAVVVLVSAIGIGGLVVVRVQNQPDDQVELTGDPTADARSAVARTRQRVADVSVTDVRQAWIAPRGEWSGDLDELVEQTDPTAAGTTVTAANGDWSVEIANPRLSVEFRYVDGEWYERGFRDRRWEHVVSEDGQGPTDISGGDIAIRDVETVINLLERYDGNWTSSSDDDAGLRSYAAADPRGAQALAEQLELPWVSNEGQSELPYQPLVATVRLWIDDDTGLLQRVVAELRAATDPDPNEGPAVLRHDVTLRYGDPSPVEAPEAATDITLEEWCERNELDCDELRPSGVRTNG